MAPAAGAPLREAERLWPIGKEWSWTAAAAAAVGGGGGGVAGREIAFPPLRTYSSIDRRKSRVLDCHSSASASSSTPLAMAANAITAWRSWKADRCRACW